MKIKHLFPALLLAFALPVSVSAQTSKNTPKNQLAETRSELISATEAYKTSAQEVIKFQEQEVANATAKAEQLRKLVADGLVARNELSAAEQVIAAATARLEATKKQIADSDNLIVQIKEAEKTEKALAKAQAAQSRRLVQPVSMRYYGMAGWALSNISSVQAFFSSNFGRPLPISTMGQSNTHNAMGWDHRNSADVGVHPDSAEGRALIGFLQSKGIPFLAFRGAIPGVSTGPHIHIGYPSGRLG
ncbi:MAG TPA: hypothetical protein VIT88_14895 [Pyrinomonadaceae bacterium]